MKRLTIGALVMALAGLGQLSAGTPGDGNGKKVVFPFDFTVSTPCESETLTLHVGGWAQFGVFGSPKNRNIELSIFHTILTFTNAEGERFVTRDVGPDHRMVNQDGRVILTITGRALTGSGVIGHVVVDFETGETLFVAGQEIDMYAEACAALT